MLVKIIIVIVVLVVIREFLAILFNWGGDEPRSPGDLFRDIKHNHAIDKEWEKNGRPIVSTTVGWRRDPHNKQDGYKSNGDGSYSKLIHGGTKEYREQFEKDVEKSRK